MLKFSITNDARQDLDSIWLHIAQDNLQAANKVEDEIVKSFYLLSDNPLIGHKREDLTHLNVRFWSVYSYLIVYDYTTKPLSIVRIVSGYRDVQSLLN